VTDEDVRAMRPPQHYPIVTSGDALGSAVVDKPVVYFVSDGGLSFDAWPRTRGLFGNALLADDFVLIIDLVRSRIGLMRSAVLLS
jgi:hypothetical protein